MTKTEKAPVPLIGERKFRELEAAINAGKDPYLERLLDETAPFTEEHMIDLDAFKD